jgi:hypothetical protein
MEADPIQIFIDLIINALLGSLEQQYSVLFYLFEFLQALGLFA